MEVILSQMILNITSDVLLQSARIQSVTQQYLHEATNIALISDNVAAWNVILSSFSVVIRSVGNNELQELPVSSYILDIQHNEWAPEHLQLFKRNADTKFIVVTKESNAERVRENFQTSGVCHVLLLTVTPHNILVTPLRDPCKGIGEEAILTESGSSITCIANVSFLDIPPNNMITEDGLYGFEGLMILTTAEHLGLHLTYINRGETGHGQFSPPSELQGDIATGNSIAAAGALYPFTKRGLNAELVFGCSILDIAFSVPDHAGQVQPTWFLILVSELSPTVWICILAVYLSLIPISAIIEWNSKRDVSWPIHIFAIIIGAPQRVVLPMSLTMIVSFFGIIVTAYYLTMMTSHLTAPSEIPEITNLKDLDESGLRLMGIPTAAPLVAAAAAAAPNNINKRNILARYEPVSEDLDIVLPRIAERRDSAYLRHRANLNYFAQKNKKTVGRIHVVEEPIVSYTAVTLMPKHSCFHRRFQTSYNRLCESGLGGKWMKDLTSVRRHQPDTGPKKLALEHILGFLLLIAFGWTLAIICFIAELVVYYVTKKLRGTGKGSKLFLFPQ